MIFLDTCVWVELLGVRTPVKEHEVRQATFASELLNDILKSGEKIITCKEQIIELVSAIEKVTMRTVNRGRKDNKLPGIGSLKEFRKLSEFQNTKNLCESVINDVYYFAKLNNIGEYDFDNIIQNLDLADINDCLYYEYCVKEKIDFYTFDLDIRNLGDSQYVHCYLIETDNWS